MIKTLKRWFEKAFKREPDVDPLYKYSLDLMQDEYKELCDSQNISPERYDAVMHHRRRMAVVRLFGYDAAQCGLKRTENPYVSGTAFHASWDRGYAQFDGPGEEWRRGEEQARNAARKERRTARRKIRGARLS